MTLVKGRGFDSWRRVGSVMQAVKVYNMRDVDELIFVDITATNDKQRPDFQLVDDFADECFMPLTVGGGVKTLDDVGRLLEVGADKVSINSATFADPKLISISADMYGSQCVVASIDFKYNTSKKKYEVFSHSGKITTGKDPIKHALDVEKYGAGEILLTSINRDGTMDGYDLNITKKIAQEVKIPVISSGGAGNYEHMYEVLSIKGVEGAAAASIFHFTEQTPLEAKAYLQKKGIIVRAKSK